MSIVNIQWTLSKIERDIGVPGVDEYEDVLRKIANLQQNVEYKFEYVYAIIIACLIWRIIEIVQFNAEIGPLVKIVGKMTSDFINFIMLYLILVFMFAIVGNVNFIFELQ